MTEHDLFDISIPMSAIDHDVIDDRRQAMEDAGVTHGILVADQRGSQWRPDAVRTGWDTTVATAAQHPSTFSAAIGVDPTTAESGHRAVRSAVNDGGVAAHAVPHAFGLAPDNAAWYPIYSACSELGIPIIIELGIRRSVGTRVRSVGRPICLDAVACDFPDLVLVAIGSWPWVDEAVSMAYKHQGIYLAIGGDDPGHDHPALAKYASTWGRIKVVFASSGTDPIDAVSRARATGLTNEDLAAMGRRGSALV